MTACNENRRAFLATCLCVATIPLLGACASLATRHVPVIGERARVTLGEHPELGRPGGAIKILPQGARDPLIVLALDGGAFSVLTTVCTHRGCEVDVRGPRLVCPCHGSTYDVDGRVLRGPAERPLVRFASSVANGVLEIDVRRPA